MKSLYNKNDFQPACSICAHGIISADGDSVLCVKTGIRKLDSKCGSYKYDPLKRVPARRPPLGGNYNPDDFKL